MKNNMRRPYRKLWFIPIALVALFGFGLVTMLLWNWLVPVLFHGPIITYWQAFGLLLLSKILFGGFKGRPGGWHHRGDDHGMWKEKMRAHMANMTPEQKERMKERFKSRHINWDMFDDKAETGDEQKGTEQK